ncbi:hypothetical protein CHM34_11270 [Paludifilum halophilum]|uniref:Uncharacterized protein n=1 Tax=Paludifilum halophilum TaxID=1642702 RepID=A0A235B5A7_9BACL|nr:hypothetical protein CHM34_11270 [Paludifilum halophilum]
MFVQSEAGMDDPIFANGIPGGDGRLKIYRSGFILQLIGTRLICFADSGDKLRDLRNMQMEIAIRFP